MLQVRISGQTLRNDDAEPPQRRHASETPESPKISNPAEPAASDALPMLHAGISSWPEEACLRYYANYLGYSTNGFATRRLCSVAQLGFTSHFPQLHHYILSSSRRSVLSAPVKEHELSIPGPPSNRRLPIDRSGFFRGTRKRECVYVLYLQIPRLLPQ